MIEKCCICNKPVESRFKLPFKYTDELFPDIYYQDIGICSECGFIFTRNPLTAEQLENRYKNHSKYEYDSNYYILSENDTYVKRCRRQKHFIKDSISEEIGSMLEIGAASGYNLSLYKDEMEVLGVEPSKNNCTLAKKNYNVNMFNGLFSEYLSEAAHKKFDLIFLSHTLEHIVNPFEFISQCSEICGKYMFIEVPTMDYKFIDEPFGMFCDEHVNYFTLESLYNIMQSLNYKLVTANIFYDNNCYISSGNPSLSSLWEKSNDSNIKLFSQRSEEALKSYIKKNNMILEHVKKQINLINNSERLAIWGTGNHLSMLLANTDLHNKNIVKFYDSDVKKHGMTILNREIYPFDENDIISGQVESILIGTYTAQIPIYNILKKYEDKCKIYKLYDI